MKGKEIWKKINENQELKRLELLGFQRGDKIHKTMNVDRETILHSLQKQWRDLTLSWLYQDSDKILKRRIADLRNVAGCLFLKIEQKEE